MARERCVASPAHGITSDERGRALWWLVRCRWDGWMDSWCWCGCGEAESAFLSVSSRRGRGRGRATQAVAPPFMIHGRRLEWGPANERIGVGVLPVLLLLLPVGAAAAAAMGFSSTPNLKLQLKLEPRPRIGTSRRLVRLRCALSSEPVPPMTVSITGATGFIGRRLVHRLLSDDHKVCVLTRSASNAASVFPASTYPGLTIAEQGDWEACVRGSSAVVNLAGMPISTRWSPEIKQEIKQSRVNVTSKVVKYINHAGNADTRPSVFVSATAIGYYGTSEIHSFDESSPSGKDYLAEVCREWEATACQVNQEDVRLVLLRIGVVLGKDGGALAKMIPLFMMFAGGPLGTGRQWFSWIHLDDLVNLIYESLTNPTYEGVINGTAPNPVRLSELCERLGRIVGRPSWLPVPEFALKAVLGEGASVVLEGQKVLPAKAKDLGFSYRYPYVEDALKAIARDL